MAATEATTPPTEDVVPTTAAPPTTGEAAEGAQPVDENIAAPVDTAGAAPPLPQDGQAAAPTESAAPHGDTEPANGAAGGPSEVTAAAPAPPSSAPPLLVRFSVRREGFFFMQHCPSDAPASVLYGLVETMFRIERRAFSLYWEERPLAATDLLQDACAIASDLRLTVELEFENMPEFLRNVNAGEQVLRSIEVPVHYGDDVPSKTIFVTMTKAFERKPFLGGYRNKKTDAMYHHATTQTQIEREARRDATGKASRVTQTQGTTRSVQTRRECATQMSRPDVVVDTTFDRVVVAQPYYSADELFALQAHKAMKLQAFVRGWRARRIAAGLREERNAEEEALRAEDDRRRQQHQQKRQEEIQRRTHPRTAKDFAVLYNELEAWRLQETQRIHESAALSDGERRVAMQELLKKETKLLQTIDRLQIHANQENRTTRINKKLEKMSSAKTWGTTRSVQVETPFTIRARELRDLYNGLQLSGLSIDERLDILLHVKWTVKEFDCPLTRDIVELIDREADLLNRGRRDGTLATLRQRTANLFLQFVETPEFNPEALQFQNVPLEHMARPSVQLSKK